MKFTREQLHAIRRICEDYDFDNLKELRAFLRDEYGDAFCPDWFKGKTVEECYNELQNVVGFINN